jgi:NAD+ synthase (glutamine-hydrolysing)
MKIGIAQLNPTVGDLRGNHDQILCACKKFASDRVDLVITPELALCGYPPRDLLLDNGFILEMAIALNSLAQSIPNQVSLLVGTVDCNPEANARVGKPLFNGAALLTGGQVKQLFHKRLLPTYDVFDEDRYFQAGVGDNWFEMFNGQKQTWRVGVTICEDIWNDQDFWGRQNYVSDPVADLASQEVDLLVNLSASPYAVGKPQMRRAMLRHSAIAHQLPLIYVNQVGANDDLIFDGNSIALDHNGAIIGQAKPWELEHLVVEIDRKTEHFSEINLDFDQNLNKNSELSENVCIEILAALVLGVKDYAAKCDFSQVVIGLSGGIDSALVAAIATFALGKENVLGVLMPSPYSSDHSLNDAIALAKNLGIRTEQIKIEPIMTAFDQGLADLFVDTVSDITEENLQSRIRGSLLMAISNKFGHLLLSTGNKSEMAVGYCTLYGDMNGGLAVISDLPKTEVYRLCEWINLSQNNLIPPNILTKAPSAELRPGQLDRDLLPDYQILDDILAMLIGDRASCEQIIAAGHCPKTVNKIMAMVTRAEFKRRQAPPGLKISDRAFGSGWRMPIASRRTRLS